MGTSGPKVFDSDMAADVRSEYRDLVAEGLEGASATDRLLEAYSDWADDPDVGPDFWIGLAVAQAEVGRLEERVRDRALAHVDDGADAARFVVKDQVAARREVLAKVRQTLTGPQKTPTRVRKRPKSICPYEVGDVLRVTLTDGHHILLCVQGIFRDRGGAAARVVVLDWSDTSRIPSKRRLRRIGTVAHPPLPSLPGSWEALGFILVAAAKEDRVLIEKSVRVVQAVDAEAKAMGAKASMYVVPWTDLDRWFKQGSAGRTALASATLGQSE